MRLEPLLSEERTAVLRGCGDRDAVLAGLSDLGAGAIEGMDASALLSALVERENQYPTSTPDGVAFPHAMLPDLERTVVVVVALSPPVDFRPGQHPPIRVAFGMFGSASRPFDHVQLLARLARIVRNPGVVDRLGSCEDAGALFRALVDEDRAHG
jgi:PTS system nitrogen regulatory IIA component